MFTGTSYALIDAAHVKGMWLFEEGKGDKSADVSGTGLDAKLVSGPKWVEGKFGKALEFDGKASYVEIPEHENPSDAITVTAWAKSPNPAWNQHGFLVEKRDAYILHPVQGATTMAWCVVNGAPWNAPQSWNTGAVGPKDITAWHMYTATFDSKTGRWAIYIDAVESSKLDLNKAKLTVERGPVHIGWDECCGGRWGAATIDEVAIFDVALTPDEIKDVMNNGLYQSVLAVQPNGKLSTVWGRLKDRE
jgi:hypothetical protein